MQYIILPQWLCKALKKAGEPLECALNYEKLKTILSPEEVLFYSITQKYWLLERVQNRFSKFIARVDQSLQCSMPKGMTYQYTDEEHIQLKLCLDGKTGDEAMTKLFLFGIGPGEPFSGVKLNPVLVGKDTMGLIIETCKEMPAESDLYEEVFKILQLRYRYDDILKMPLYSGYLRLLDQQFVR